MKKLIILLFALLPFVAKAQNPTDITKNMSVWARDIYNANLDIFDNRLDTDSARIDAVESDITTLESRADSLALLYTINATYLKATVKDSSEAITVSADSTWYPITNENNTFWTVAASGFTESGDSMFVTSAGDYFGIYELGGSAGVADTLEIGLLRNGSLTSGVSRMATDSVDVTFNGNLPFYFTATAGDTLLPVIKQISGTSNFSISNGNLVLIRRK